MLGKQEVDDGSLKKMSSLMMHISVSLWVLRHRYPIRGDENPHVIHYMPRLKCVPIEAMWLNQTLLFRKH